MIDNKKINNVHIQDKISSMLFKIAAVKGNIPIALANYALCLKNGRGVGLNDNEACEYYYKAMLAGNFESREDLDKLLPHAEGFKKKHRDY